MTGELAAFTGQDIFTQFCLGPKEQVCLANVAYF